MQSALNATKNKSLEIFLILSTIFTVGTRLSAKDLLSEDILKLEETKGLKSETAAAK